MKRIVLEVDDEFHQVIKEQAIKQRKTMREVMTDLLRAWVSAPEGNHANDTVHVGRRKAVKGAGKTVRA